MTYHPKDHLPKSLRDDDRAKAQEAIEHLKALYRHAKRVANGLTTLTERQQQGGLTRSESAVLGRMVLANLRASARGELHFRPGRACLARDTGYSERTVSKALSRLKGPGLIEAARYSKGRRVKAHGLATEWRSGGLDRLLTVLSSLGYRLGKGISDTLTEAVNWAPAKLSKRHENKQENRIPTGKLVPGTLVCIPHAAPGIASVHRDAPFRPLRKAPCTRIVAHTSPIGARYHCPSASGSSQAGPLTPSGRGRMLPIWSQCPFSETGGGDAGRGLPLSPDLLGKIPGGLLMARASKEAAAALRFLPKLVVP